MLVKVDFKKERITLGSKSIRWLEGYIQKQSAMALEYSKVKSKVSKYFVINGINYGELLGILFYQNDNYFPKAPGLITIFNYLEIIGSLPEKSRLELEIDDFYCGTFRKCAGLVGKKKGFKIRLMSENYSQRNFGFLYDYAFLVKSLLKARILTRLIIGNIRKLSQKHDKIKRKVVFLANVRFENNKPEDNSLFGGVVRNLNSKGIGNKIIRYEELIQLTNLKRFIKEFMMQRQAYIGDYYSLKHFRDCKNDFKELRKRWDAVKDSPEFKSIFNYKGYEYYDIIKPKFELIFNALSYIACDSKNISKRIIDQEGYNVIVLDHEENLYGKGFMLNTRLDRKKRTAALSHEIIWPGSIYAHEKDESILDRGSELWRPLPDIKCVWSDYAKKVLMESCNYPEKIIKVTGNPKFDFLFNTQYNDKKTIDKYGLSKTKRKVLCVVRPFYSLNDISYLDELNQVTEKINDVEIIIKPHPLEVNIERIKEKIALFHNPNLKYVNNKDDIYPLIHACDYILTEASTVGFEGILADKITFSWYPEELNIAPFLKGNMQLKNLAELGTELKKLDEKQNLDLVMEKNKSIKKTYHYKNDGKASERVAYEIEKLMK